MQHCLTDILIFLKKLVLLFVISTWYSISFGQTTYTVNSTADTPDANLSDDICADANGDCTFRAAIQNANKTPQKDIIAFNIPGQGPFYIRPDGIYNNIIQPLIIDGTTQPGWSEGKPVVVIDGSNVPVRQVGLRIMNNASGCIIRGLVMGGYRPGEDWRNGFAILIQTNDNTIEGSYFGIDADGETALPNNRGIQIMNGSNNTIGGLTLVKRNVISGNLGIGVAIFGNQPPEGFAGPNSLNNLIIGNYIGIDANGSSAVGNSINLQITDGAEKTTIEKNIISGATSRGVVLASTQTIDTKIIGNYIGTDASGLEAIPNQVHGINLLQGVNRTTIGGSRPEERNIISGNGSFGISFQFSRASPGTIPVTGNLVIGNYVGLDVNGEALPNQNGIQITGLSENNTIGGTEDNERNVISGNLREGILISGSNANENKIRGNFIGTDVSGTTAIGNRVGVYISEGNGTAVGGTDLGEGNLISGNTQHGLYIFNSSNNWIEGNYIGTSQEGNDPLPNIQNGILILGASNDNTIGGLNPNAANTIAHNGRSGVLITRGSQGNVDPQRNTVSGNRIFSNQLSGIGLDTPGIIPNDPGDADTGPNQLQNFPEIAKDFAVDGSQVSLRYFVPSRPDNSAYPIQVEFFIDDGNRQGRTLVYVDQFTETDYSNGPFKTLDFSLPPTITFQQGDNILATATDANGNTSEFGGLAAEFDLSLSIQGEGLIASDPDQTSYYGGSEVTLTASPSTGWAFDRWEGDLTGTTSPLTLAMDGDRSVTAVFIRQTFSLNADTEGGGSVEADPESNNYTFGTEVMLTAVPSTGWAFDRWEGDLTGNTNPATLILDEEKEVTAVFVEVENNLEIQTTGEGTVSREPDQGTYSTGTEVTLTATPATGWAFDRWEGDLTGATSPITLTMDGDRSVTAVFIQQTFGLTAETQGSGTVEIDPESDEYTYGTEVTLTAVPSTGWAFDRWEGDLTGNINPATTTMLANRSFTAVFIQQTYGLTAKTQGNGTLEFDPEADEYIHGTDVTLTAVPSIGWAFDRWEGDLTGNTNPATIAMEGNRSVTAVFVEIEYTLSIDVEGSGQVGRDPERTGYTHGSVVNLTANPEEGWVFGRWEGDLAGNDNPAMILMDGDKTVSAIFVRPLGAELSVVHATCPGSGDGSITVTPTGGTAPYQFDWGAFGTAESGTMANLAAGTYPVTVTDANGLTLILQAEVLDTDTSSPIPVHAELPVIRENVIVSALAAPTATHACEGSIVGTTDVELPIRASTIVTWTFTDSSGNSVTQEQQVVVEVDEITLYPNPVMEEGFWIAFPSASRGIRYNATLYSAGGSMIAEREFEIGEGSNSIRWDIDHVDWSNGAYLLVLRSSTGVEAIKLLKQSK